MYPKIIQLWIALQKKIPKYLRVKIITVIFLSSLFEIVGLGAIFPILRILMDLSLANSYQMYIPYSSDSPNLFLLSLLVACFIFYVFKNFFLGYSTHQIFKSVFYLQNLFSNQVFEKLLNAKYSVQRGIDINKQSSLLVNDIPLVCIEWYLPAVFLISDTFLILLLLIFLGWVSPFLLIFIGVIGATLFGLIIYFSRVYSYKWGVERKFFDEIKLDYFINGLSHIKEIITYNKIPLYLNKFREANNFSARAAKLQSTAQVLPKLFVESIAILALLSIIFFMVISGHDMKHEIPVIGVYAVAAFRIIPTINRMMQSYQMLQYGLNSTEGLISEIPNEKAEVNGNNSDSALKNQGAALFSSLKIANLDFIHEGKSSFVLKGLSLSMLCGEKIAIVGQSGAGKSTLIDILLGLNLPTKGSIQFNNQSIFDHLNIWRAMIGYVPQDLHLTSTSIRENIIFGDVGKSVDQDLFAKVTHITGIRDFMGQDLDRSLGRQGLKISGGQKQRIAIARALYKRPQVLIFDEATSALDQRSEEEIMSNIQKYFGGISLISVTHKIYNNSLYDKIYQLKEGSLVELKA